MKDTNLFLWDWWAFEVGFIAQKEDLVDIDVDQPK